MDNSPPATRLDPIDDADWPTEITDLRDGFAGSLNIYRVMAHHPRLVRAWTTFRQHVVKDNSLSPRLQEIAILRAGHRWGSEYEWAHHVHRGRLVGLTDLEIERARAPTDDGADDLGLVISAVDQLLGGGGLQGSMLDRLCAEVGKQGVLDLFATVGMYTTLAFIANTFDPPIDPSVLAGA